MIEEREEGRKTCPTNRGLRHTKLILPSVRRTSEDLPHKSGITTDASNLYRQFSCVGRLAPQIGDYDQPCGRYRPVFRVGRLAPQIGDYDAIPCPTRLASRCRKTCPTNRGLRRARIHRRFDWMGRKTCPTNRGLRQGFAYQLCCVF